jgi:hypothetical protein
MARRTAVAETEVVETTTVPAKRGRGSKNSEPATVREVREYFAENPGKLPEGVESLGNRGRLSQAVKDAFTNATKREIV